MSSKHTPGPWFYCEDRAGRPYIDTAIVGDLFAVVLPLAEEQANVRLWAAAPDLLEDATNSRAQLAVMADHLDYALGHLRRESHDNWCAIHNDESAACNCWVQGATDGLRAARAHLADDAAMKKARGEP